MNYTSSEYLITNNIFTNLFSMIIFIRIMNIKRLSSLKKVMLGFSTIASSVIYVLCRNHLDVVLSNMILIVIQTLVLKYVTKLNISNIIIGVVISYVMSYICSLIAALIEFPIQILLGLRDTTVFITVVNIVIKNIIQGCFVYVLLKLKRLKGGLNFLKKQNEYVDFAIINISIIFVLVQGLISCRDGAIYKSLLYYYIVIGALMIYMINRTIVLYYKQKLTDDTMENLKLEINEKNNEIKRLSEENYKIHKVNHEFYNKQKALEKKVNDYINSMETSEEIGLLDRINEVTKEHADSIESVKSLDKLPVTEIQEIDDMFSYMRQECIDNSIDFSLKIYGNIFYMVNNLISKNKLETMIGDHIRDAIIAINSADSKNRKILATIGKGIDYYELCIFDSGIEFEIDTLNKLGIEQVTTHKDKGGSGMGFITTFETMKECNASVEIEEIGSISKDNYTKAVRFVFDNKNEYRIKSYRADELKGRLDITRIKVEA